MLIYIAEDEPLAAQKLQLFLQKLGERPEDIQLFGNGRALIEALTANKLPDVIFLDIHMPEMTGLDVLSQLQNNLGDNAPRIIITSAYDRYAIDGFNFGVADYLLKPYTLDRLRLALSKVRVEPMLSIRCEGRTERIRVADIVCLEALKDYTVFTLADGRKLTTLGTLSGFEQQLPSSLFVRVQRSYIIGIDHVQSYNSQTVVLATGIEVPIGRTYRESFDALVKQ